MLFTFEEFTEICKGDYSSKELAPTTYSRYVAILNTRIFVGNIGLPVINLHGLKHTNATLLISQNYGMGPRINLVVIASGWLQG